MQKALSSLKSYHIMMKSGCYNLTKEDPKVYMHHMSHPLSSADINMFSLFVISRNADIYCALIHKS